MKANDETWLASHCSIPSFSTFSRHKHNFTVEMPYHGILWHSCFTWNRLTKSVKIANIASTFTRMSQLKLISPSHLHRLVQHYRSSCIGFHKASPHPDTIYVLWYTLWLIESNLQLSISAQLKARWPFKLLRLLSDLWGALNRNLAMSSDCVAIWRRKQTNLANQTEICSTWMRMSVNETRMITDRFSKFTKEFWRSTVTHAF